MWRWIKRIVLWLLLALLLLVAGVAAFNWKTVRYMLFGGLKVYETTPPTLPATLPRPAILVFSKTNGYRHEDGIAAASRMFAEMARRRGWGIFQTESGAAFTPEILSRFDAVVFNSVSGDVFTPAQRAAFKSFVEGGGGFVGIHAAGDNSHAVWPWYQNVVIGARFTQHTASPHLQTATLHVEDRAHPAGAALPGTWRLDGEEWYSFERSPRRPGYNILMTVDEGSYKPDGMFGRDLRMGADHPIAWWHCVGRGNVFYTATGHSGEIFARPEIRAMLTGATDWALRLAGPKCGQPQDAAPDAPGAPARSKDGSGRSSTAP